MTFQGELGFCFSFTGCFYLKYSRWQPHIWIGMIVFPSCGSVKMLKKLENNLEVPQDKGGHDSLSWHNQTAGTMTPEYLLYKTWFACIEPEEPSCKFLWGMPPAAASQRGAQCKTSEVTLFRPKQSGREDHHVSIQSLATTKCINFNTFDLIK